MFSAECNIDKKDRVNRTVIGIILCLGVLLGLGRFFFFLVGTILIVEGAIGWCGIPLLVEKWRKQSQKK